MPWSELIWKVVVAAAVLGIGAVLGSWLAGLARGALERSGLDPMVRRLLVKAVRPLVVAVAAVAALESLDVDLTTVAAMAGAATLAVGVALQGSLSNVASGAMLLTLRPYREGEFVTVAGQSGTVTEQGLFAVTLRGADGVMITVPNNAAFGNAIHNFGRHGQRRVQVAVVLEHGANVDRAIERLVKVAAEDERVLEEPAPQGLVLGVEDRGVRVALRAWVAAADFAAVNSGLSRDALATLKKGRLKLAPVPMVDGAA